MPKPAFVCLHGAWHSPACYDAVKSILTQDGYLCICPPLPSVGCNPPTSDFTEDVFTIRSAVADLVKDHDVIVVMHSYSGIPGGQALDGLDKKTTTEQGLRGGVVRLVYIMSFIVPEGFQHSPKGTRDFMVAAMKTDFEAGTVTVGPEDAKDLFYQDLSDDAVSKLAAKLRPQSLGVFWSTTSYAAWRHIPTTYVICLKDTPTTVTAVDGLLALVRSTDNHKLDTVIKREVGHSPFISQPEWTAEMLKEAASVESV